ncbi:thiopurine S-methyltransferase [Methyloprofundus sedimenti]|uniref:Thiopurine S-methyltransferase n=1 Tax=Methyloprofundus sedimenti TaxID=1420851 RepID=A0A1V8M1G2_9GAMM|nr:thiopurine S-methyltransferase [Methyloprofundus sedimenti]OQK15401.1 thiopurine S-methyltransferase [Methyloprofundus sedimenti]
MHTDFWLERWEQNQIGFHEQEINAHLQKFWETLDIPANSKIFVPLCGKSRDILWLLSHGYQVVGVEISPLAVQSFFSENQLEPIITDCGAFQCWETEGLSLYLGNFFDLSNEHLNDCLAIYDRAALIALPSEMRQEYVQHLNKIAPALEHTLLVTLEYTQYEMPGPPFSVDDNEVHSLFGKTYAIEPLSAEDVLQNNENFRARGLSNLKEKVYRLSKRPDVIC